MSKSAYSSNYAIALGFLLCIVLSGCSQPAKNTEPGPAKSSMDASVPTVLVISNRLKRTIRIPAELTAFPMCLYIQRCRVS